VLIKGWQCLGGVSSLVGIVFGFLQLRIQGSPLSQCSFVYMVNLHSYVEVLVLTLKSI
jgi:hypothetical protein